MSFRKYLASFVLALYASSVLAAGVVTLSGPRLYVEGGGGGDDETMDSFTFTDQTNVPLSQLTTHSAITVSGLGSGISVTCNATYSLIDKNNDGSFQASQTVENGDTFRNRMNASWAHNDTWQSSVDCNGVSDTWYLTTVAASPSGDVTADIVASRTSGPAPLAVFFDATASTAEGVTDPFRELGYKFTFADAGSGTWTYSGLSKNEQVGAPLAAHVFETPGTYIVQVAARNSDGDEGTDTVVITVTNPDTVYAGTNTVCLSRNTDQTGCPSGATQLNSVSSWPTFASNKRYLLHRSHDFSSLGSLNFKDGSDNGVNDAQVGAFGSGAKPIISYLSMESGTAPSGWMRRVVAMDLNSGFARQFRGGEDILMLRIDSSEGISFADAHGYVVSHDAGTWENPTNNFVVDSTVNVSYNNDQIGISGNAYRLALLGNHVIASAQHNIRLWQVYKGILAHNSLSGDCDSIIRATIKIQSAGTSDFQPTMNIAGGGNSQRTKYVTIANNLIGSTSSNIQWLSGVGPQNHESSEGVEDVTLEDNEFRHGVNYADVDSAWFGRRITDRGNTNVTEGGTTKISYGTGYVLGAAWDGPYYPAGTSMRGRF
jgi:hypothetical protein